MTLPCSRRRCRRALLATGILLFVAAVFAPATESSLEGQLELALSRSDSPAAIELLERIIAKGGDTTAAQRQLAELQIAVGDYERAARTLERLRKQGADQLDVIAGSLAFATGDSEAGFAHFSAAAEAGHASAAALRELIRQLMSDPKRADEAVRRADQLVALERSASTLLTRCRAKLFARDWQGAFDDCVAANELDPADPQVKGLYPAFERLGAAGISKLKKLAQAGHLVEQARVLADAGLAAQAASLLHGVITKETPEIHLRLFYAGLFSGSGQIPLGNDLGVMFTEKRLPLTHEALAVIAKSDQAVAKNPGADTWYERAWHLNDVRQYLLALEDCGRALDSMPDDPRAAAEAAFASFKLGRLKDAYRFITKATGSPSANDNMWRIRGEIEAALARHAEAVASFEKSLALANSDQTRRLLDHVKRIAAVK